MNSIYREGISAETVSYLLSRGLSDQAIASFQLGTVSGGGEHSQYRGMLSIPYLTPLAGCVGFKFRAAHTCTDDCGHPKYITPYPTRLYNTSAFDEGERLGHIGVCEGEFDAMILSAMCGIPTVGVPGVETWTAHKSWPLLFQGFGRVLVFQDFDEPGLKLARRILADVTAAELVDMEGLGSDVNEIFLAYGAESIREVAEV